MAAKTQNATQDENKMTEPYKFDDSLEFAEVAASTSTASSFKLKMWRREPEITWTVVQDATTMTDSDDFEELEILQMTVASTSAASHLLHKEIQDAVQEDEMIKPNGHDDSRADRRQSIVEPATPSELAVPSTSTSTSTASHSTSYQSLLLQKKSLKFEIDNIGKVMSCCATAVKRWLSVIDDKPFPEKEYLQEYMEGTDKLHELQCKEMELEDKQEKILEMEKLKKLKRTGKETKKSSTILLVHLPNNQHTTVKITKGLTLRQAVAKPMQRRQLILEDCAAYIRHRITYFISWDTDISTLQCNEVFVETLEQIPVPVFLSHHFVGNTFLLGYCHFCEKGVLYGLYCKACNRKFHTKCVTYASRLCEHVKRRKAYYERLLANNPTTGIVQVRARPVPVPSVSRRDISRRIGAFSAKSNALKVDKSTQVITKKRNAKYGRYGRQRRHKKKSTNQDNPCVDDAGSNDSEEDSIFSQDSVRDWKVMAEDVSFEDEIGEGTYGTVYKADWHGPVAIKKLKIKVPTQEQIEMFRNEVNVLRKVRHQRILSFMGCICKPYLAIITQLCEGQSLYQRLHVEEDPIEMITIVIICRQTSEGMDYLHARNILHRDLKSRNIFFHNGLHVKIGDFGLAVMRSNKKQPDTNDDVDDDDHNDDDNTKGVKKKEKDIKDHEKQLAGSIPWMAPEVLRMRENENPYSFQSDVYSFGIVMYELFARDIPYVGIGAQIQCIIYNVGRGCLSPNLTKLRSDTPKKLKDLLIQCIAFEREKRPLFPCILRRTYAAFKFTPKIRRTTSLPSKTDELADTYIERADDVQDFLTSDADDYKDDDVNINANTNASASVEDVFNDF
ncbi:serine/threonine-protein kinase A-Raf [Temnothorax longispinosus]|uniref:serine/threonine-protein kinase A-Raf n=1 Tax=Temnothorax longispinosus TaxID=300112 RepID=UPI003A9A1730